MHELIETLAREFVMAYRALREALGDAAALMHGMVQAARRRWQEART